MKCIYDKRRFQSFLKESENSRSREAIFSQLLFYELRLSAAKRGYSLHIHIPDIDRQGFDAILDDADVTQYVQIKTVLTDSTTSHWDIHKRLLRPSHSACDHFGFESSPTGCGLQGGVILIELKVEDSGISHRYYYADIFTITAMFLGVIKVSTQTQKALKTFYSNIGEGVGRAKIKIPKTLFVKCQGVDQLLSLSGLHSIYHSDWRYLLSMTAKYDLRGDDVIHELNELPVSRAKQSIHEELENLIELI